MLQFGANLVTCHYPANKRAFSIVVIIASGNRFCSLSLGHPMAQHVTQIVSRTSTLLF